MPGHRQRLEGRPAAGRCLNPCHTCILISVCAFVCMRMCAYHIILYNRQLAPLLRTSVLRTSVQHTLVFVCTAHREPADAALRCLCSCGECQTCQLGVADGSDICIRVAGRGCRLGRTDIFAQDMLADMRTSCRRTRGSRLAWCKGNETSRPRALAAGSKSGGMAMKLMPLGLLSNTNVRRRRRRVNARRSRMRLTQGSTGQGATQHRLG